MPEESQPAREEIWDAYVEAALAGGAPDPDEFLAGRGEGDAVLRDRLRALRDAAAREADAPDGASGLPFERLGPYRVLRRLRSGGMSRVYLGMEERLARLVALKVLHPALAGEETLAARFAREADVVARLRHPGIVRILGVGEERDVSYLAMEYVEGEGLDERIARAANGEPPMPVATVLRWGIQIADALQAAHEAGVVHRDVKPSNVRITPEGDAILLDFGIAADEEGAPLTRTGGFLGTAAYAAPEQIDPASGGGDVDGRADVYALALCLYEALAGSHPFDAGSEAETARRVLGEEAPGVRRRRPDVPRDLETVLRAAMEKDRERRHSSARRFAQDLRAVLSIRPVSVRRDGPLRRTVKFVRRHPAAAAGAAIFALVAAALLGMRMVERHREADAAVRRAWAGVAEFRERCAAARGAEEEYRKLARLVESVYMAPEQDRALEAAERKVRDSRRDREAIFYRVLSDLRRAERLAGETAASNAVRAALYRERWREAKTAGDDDAAAFYRQLALTHGAGGEAAETGRLEVVCATPGATARLYRFELQSALVPGGEARLVPVPVGGPRAVPPGSWAFRLVGDHGPLRAGDLVTAVDGLAPDAGTWRELRDRLVAGATATVEGRTRRGKAALPPGGRWRITTQPLEWPPGRECIDAGPTEVPAGIVEVVVRAPGHEEARTVVRVARGELRRVPVTLDPAGTTPAGFVRVEQMEPLLPPRFWISETEVTALEYLAFLNDPATRAEIERADGPVRFPRAPRNAAAAGHWDRDEDGRFSLPRGWPAAWPALGVSWEDARAYVAWWNRDRNPAPERFRASLPRMYQWSAAGGHQDDRRFVFGNRFRPKWVSSCYSRPHAEPVPVRSHPRDESPFGVFDLAGSLFEWTEDWWDEAAGLRRLAGGSWARAPAEFFKIWGGIGSDPASANDEVGFRLVLLPPGEER